MMVSSEVNQYDFGRDYGLELGGGYDLNQCGEKTNLYAALELVFGMLEIHHYQVHQILNKSISFMVWDVCRQDKNDHYGHFIKFSSMYISTQYRISQIRI